jgi:hypothetical protein
MTLKKLLAQSMQKNLFIEADKNDYTE